MKFSTRSLLKTRTPLLLSALSLLLLSSMPPLLGRFTDRELVARAYVSPPSTVYWHAGNFRYLDALSGDLVTFIQGLDHPDGGGYGKLSSTRKANFNAFLDAMFTAIDASLADGNTGDWCGVKSSAAAAGYAIRRFYDTASGRWFIYAYDTTSFGQAYFFINPFAKRNLVIEVPHEGLLGDGPELNTGTEGVQIFKALAARALIINKEHRCSDPDASVCSATTTACGVSGPVRESDVAHHTANTFYLLHVRYNDMDPVTNFVQLHGFSATSGDMVEIGDGTNDFAYSGSVSVTFANNLRRYVPSPGAVCACQQGAGPSNLCGETNVEGRYTNSPNTATCPAATTTHRNRFLHIEQALTLRDNDNNDGWYWGDVRDALLDTWPDCNMNNGATDCTLGPQQTQYSTLSCSSAGATTMNLTVTFYGYPDNDDGSGHFSTNLIAYGLQWQGHSRHLNAQGEPVASGVGTYDDPITVAASQGNASLPPGTLIYIPGLKKYFLVEDICGNCTSTWIDVWMESNSTNSSTAVGQCESNWTGNVNQLKEAWVNPSSGLDVDVTPFFNTASSQCNPVTW
jgi:3D (Asp-Asp-Asp) domain-containing protein